MERQIKNVVKCTDCTVFGNRCVSDMEVDKCVSSTKPKARNARSRTMFKLKPLEGGQFKLERERGSLLHRDEKTSRKPYADKLSFKNILDKFENNSGKYTFIKVPTYYQKRARNRKGKYC